jgi:hypothetical protein
MLEAAQPVRLGCSVDASSCPTVTPHTIGVSEELRPSWEAAGDDKLYTGQMPSGNSSSKVNLSIIVAMLNRIGKAGDVACTAEHSWG